MKDPHRNIAGALSRRGTLASKVKRGSLATALARRAGAGALAIAAALGAVPALAALGQSAATIDTDRIQVRATVRQVSHAAYTVHELSTSSHGIVREYVSPAGQVFAVTWHGPSLPNLRQMLGSNFDRLANSKNRQSGGRGHLTVTEGSLVFESNGRMRSFHGRAYLNDALPPGVATHEIE